MASMSMTASSLLPSSSAGLTKLSSSTARRGLIVAKASKADIENIEGGDKGSWEMKQESSNGNGRRELVFAAVAAAASCSIANVAMGEEEEPKKGTPEAKKKYAPICVTMPTARVCRK